MSRKKAAKKKIKVRRTWIINPKTRVKEDEKDYKRSREKKAVKDIIEELT